MAAQLKLERAEQQPGERQRLVQCQRRLQVAAGLLQFPFLLKQNTQIGVDAGFAGKQFHPAQQHRLGFRKLAEIDQAAAEVAVDLAQRTIGLHGRAEIRHRARVVAGGAGRVAQQQIARCHGLGFTQAQDPLAVAGRLGVIAAVGLDPAQIEQDGGVGGVAQQRPLQKHRRQVRAVHRDQLRRPPGHVGRGNGIHGTNGCDVHRTFLL